MTDGDGDGSSVLASSSSSSATVVVTVRDGAKETPPRLRDDPSSPTDKYLCCSCYSLDNICFRDFFNASVF